mmetsp:Transcript_98301/g.316904  ORF Transcript_98301/g.316904 Transcript_98301/m.316904 type:complete len:561 (+) Transcript_98301:68-1750(+)
MAAALRSRGQPAVWTGHDATPWLGEATIGFPAFHPQAFGPVSSPELAAAVLKSGPATGAPVAGSKGVRAAGKRPEVQAHASAAEGAAQAGLGPAPHRQGRGSFIPRRLCAHWSRSGWCRKGEACTFAHGMHELHPEAQMAVLHAQGPAMMPPPYSTGLLATGASTMGCNPKVVGPVSAGAAKSEFQFNANAPAFVAPSSLMSAAFVQNEEAPMACNGVPSKGFTFNATAAPFVVATAPAAELGGAAEALPEAGVAAADELATALVPCDAGERLQKPKHESDGVEDASAKQEAEDANAKPARRKVPSPLTSVEATETTPPVAAAVMGVAAVAAAPQSPTRVQAAVPSMSPAAIAARRFLTRIGVTYSSPMSQTGQPVGLSAALPLASPKAVQPMMLSPTASVRASVLQVVADPATPGAVQRASVVQHQAESATPSAVQRTSVVHVTADPTTPGALQRTSLVQLPIDPSTPSALQQSPMASPTSIVLASPRPITRNSLLQARGVAQKIHQGPPGLSQFAPTPTSAAQSFGFIYPQPGFFRTDTVPVASVRQQRLSSSAQAQQ